MSLTSAECTKVEYDTKLYSESPPPVDTKTDKGDTATWKRRRGFALHIQVELDSSSDEAPTSSRSIYLLEIHRQIDHNELLQRWLAHSTKLLRDAERIQAALPWAKETLLHLRRFVPSPLLAECPYSTARLEANQLKQVPWPPWLHMLQAKITRHKVYFQPTFLKHFRS
jgi:hypothetical protein